MTDERPEPERGPGLPPGVDLPTEDAAVAAADLRHLLDDPAMPSSFNVSPDSERVKVVTPTGCGFSRKLLDRIEDEVGLELTEVYPVEDHLAAFFEHVDDVEDGDDGERIVVEFRRRNADIRAVTLGYEFDPGETVVECHVCGFCGVVDDDPKVVNANHYGTGDWLVCETCDGRENGGEL